MRRPSSPPVRPDPAPLTVRPSSKPAGASAILGRRALPWARIDHLWVDDRWAVARCWVGPDLGADHLPVLAEVVLRRSAAKAPTLHVTAQHG